ncbi:GNAT family N-acetyltransferase [Streptomyces sp. NPDC093516]|uniref:GNAT family N-acetyltransferase n=1 Tax=Streptomyces sp. NPDC093516 TaxID=3155304 RepID=UPI0034374EB8
MRPSRCPARTSSAARRPSGPEARRQEQERSMSDPEIRDDREAGRLEAVADGEVLGRIEYFVLDSPERALVPVHTIVEPAHEGKGIAGSLARELYAIAARERSAVAPLCPYVVKWAERHPEQAPPAGEPLLTAAKDWLRAHPGRF